MKGTPRPSWTEGRHRWLRKLQDQGAAKPKGTGEGSTAQYCRALGWTAVRPPLGHVITEAGLATLARWDAGDCAVAPRPRQAPTFAKLLQHEPAELVTRLLDMGEQHARVVYDALHTALFGHMPPATQRRFEPGGPSADVGLRTGEVAAVVLPAHQRPCPVKLYEPDVATRPDAPTECDGNVPPGCELAREIEAQAVRAPQFGRQVALKASLGQPVGAFIECGSCHGRGAVRHNFLCGVCGGSGKVPRTVEL